MSPRILGDPRSCASLFDQVAARFNALFISVTTDGDCDEGITKPRGTLIRSRTSASAFHRAAPFPRGLIAFLAVAGSAGEIDRRVLVINARTRIAHSREAIARNRRTRGAYVSVRRSRVPLDARWSLPFLLCDLVSSPRRGIRIRISSGPVIAERPRA